MIYITSYILVCQNVLDVIEGVEKPGSGGAASSSLSDRQNISNRVWQKIKTRIEELKQSVFQ